MIKGLLLTGIVLILLFLGIFAVSAVIIYSVDNSNLDYSQPPITYDNNLDDNYNYAAEKPVLINSYSDKNTFCYQGLNQEPGCGHIEVLEQDRTPCYKTVKLACGKEVKVSCDESVDQIKGCGHLDVLEQDRTPCYKTVKLDCGKEVKVRCDESVPQERGEPCYQDLDQQRYDCININKIEKECY